MKRTERELLNRILDNWPNWKAASLEEEEIAEKVIEELVSRSESGDPYAVQACAALLSSCKHMQRFA